MPGSISSINWQSSIRFENDLDAFVDQVYRPNLALYQQAALKAEEACRGILKDAGIPAIISSRAKNPERLLAKLQQRYRDPQKTGLYTSFQTVYDDLFDLVGVRIALYFPSQDRLVSELISGNVIFDQGDSVETGNVASKSMLPPLSAPSTKLANQIDPFAKAKLEKKVNKGVDVKYIPPPETDVEKRELEKSDARDVFQGYKAIHLRAKFNPARFSSNEKDLKGIPIEIQIASLLMHSWSEVNHDLAYKTLSGTLSSDETQTLHEINQLVLKGEGLLGNLKKQYEARISRSNKPFENAHELSAFLDTYIAKEKVNLGPDYKLGAVHWLLAVLQVWKLGEPNELRLELGVWKDQAVKSPVAESILDCVANHMAAANNKAAPNLTDAKNPPKSTYGFSPFLQATLNNAFDKMRGEDEKLAWVLSILGLAASLVEAPGALDNNGESMASYFALFQAGMLDVTENLELASSINSKTASAHWGRLWVWFTSHKNVRIRAALWYARARLGEKFPKV